MCFFVQTNHTRKELLFLMFKEINLRNHSSLHKLFYSLIGIRNNITHWNGSYLIFSLISFIILSKCVMKLEIRNQIAMAVDTNLLDIVISFVFFALFIIFLASLALMYFPKLTTVLNYWTPILALSIALGFSLFMYYN